MSGVMLMPTSTPKTGRTVVMAVSRVPQTVMDCHQLLVSVAA